MTCFCFKGLEGTVGGRCFLEVLVLCHSARHHVFMETICKQPKVSSCSSQLSTTTLNRIIAVYLNPSRYAFTPLIDDSDDEEIEEFTAAANLGRVTSREPYLNPGQYSSH